MAHPDFALKATFFVLTRGAFSSMQSEADRKLRSLQAMGFELQNHTLHHRYFNHLSDAAVCREIALGQAAIQQAVPEAHVDVLALPGGYYPRSRRRAILLSGESDGIHYSNRAILLAGAEPAPAPASVSFKPWHIPRILAVEGENGVTFWLNYLDHHKNMRYVSDGVPQTVAVPSSRAKQVDARKLLGAQLHVYGNIPVSADATGALVRSMRHRKHTPPTAPAITNSE